MEADFNEEDYMKPKSDGVENMWETEHLPSSDVEELYQELTSLGYEVEMFDCQKAIDVMKSDSKDAAANFLNEIGVPVVKKIEKFNGAQLAKWVVDGFVLMCG